MYADAPFFRDNEKWTCAFIHEFLLWSWEVKVGRVKPHLVSYLVLNCRSFLFVVLGFHLVSGFLQSLLGFSVYLLHLRDESG